MSRSRRFRPCVVDFRRRSDKQKVAQVFAVTSGLEEADFAPGGDLRPQSTQPVHLPDEHVEQNFPRYARFEFMKHPDALERA
jgi:hypothetical protein